MKIIKKNLCMTVSFTAHPKHLLRNIHVKLNLQVGKRKKKTVWNYQTTVKEHINTKKPGPLTLTEGI